MWTDYWSTLLSHWVQKEFDALGYPTSEELDPTDRTEAEVHMLTELTTNCTVLFHWQGYKARQNVLIPNKGPLYEFLKDKNYRIVNCVFLSKFKDGSSDLFKINNYDNVIVTKEYLAYEGASSQTVDTFDSCSLLSDNSDDLERFAERPVDFLLNKVWGLFGFKE